MGECIIVGRGGSGSSSGDGTTLISQIFLENTIWKVPKVANQNFSVRIFGGGGGAAFIATVASSSGVTRGGGGGGGFMNNAILNLNPGEEIQITIGAGGANSVDANDNIGQTGGTTFFGSYLSALGGTGGGAFTIDSTAIGVGGYGGSGGGSTGINGNSSNIANNHLVRYSGTGFQFGGGGGDLPGNGGYWGGGGGGYDAHGEDMNRNTGYGGCIYDEMGNIDSFNGYSGYGGNGNTKTQRVSNGINTIGLGLEFEGAGLGGSGNKGGGGGYGGNGGDATNFYAGGGGGGYGANGGSCLANNSVVATGGGGGGYGGDGGSVYYKRNSVGGGGGYGKYGIGGGTYCANGGIAAGGGVDNRHSGYGGNGICIIQYYI